MKRFPAVLALTMFVPGVAGAVLTPGKALLDGLETLKVGSHAVPCVIDFQGDGRKDLLIGEYLGTEPNAYGKVRFYLNRNTDQHPRFDGWTYVQASGQDIEVTGKTDT